ncbi:MAG: VWA domain-containing protein [Chloroflexota bacterium]|nr:VWA domain-containing protein [Chloroflexota bacterium]
MKPIANPRTFPRSLIGVALILVSLLSALPIGQDAALAQSTDPPAVVNVELILDLSGSMARDIGGGETRMIAAKRVLNDVIDALPETEGVNVGFRIYGHEGDNTNAGRAESCESTELVVPIAGVDKPALRAQVDAAEPIGWTPLAISLEEAAGDFPTDPDESNNIVLVTDGEETCGGDPCEAAGAIRAGETRVRSHVIGFALTDEQSELVGCIAEEGDGLNLRAANALELSDALFSVLQEIEVVLQTGELEIEEIGGLFPAATVSFFNTGDQDPRPPVVLDETNRAELEVGTYAVTWTNPSGATSRIDVLIEPGQTTWVRGSLIRFPQGAGESYVVSDLAGVTIWNGPFEFGDVVWVLPSIYSIRLDERVGDPILISAQVQTLPGSVTALEVWTAP